MRSLLRRLLGVTVRISQEEALGIARAHCERQSWPWLEPVHVVLGLRRYEVMTNASRLGGNATIWIDCSSGVVVRSAQARR